MECRARHRAVSLVIWTAWGPIAASVNFSASRARASMQLKKLCAVVTHSDCSQHTVNIMIDAIEPGLKARRDRTNSNLSNC
jgi:hypothetical protein